MLCMKLLIVSNAASMLAVTICKWGNWGRREAGNLPKYGQLLIVGIKPWEADIAAVRPIPVLYPVRL